MGKFAAGLGLLLAVMAAAFVVPQLSQDEPVLRQAVSTTASVGDDGPCTFRGGLTWRHETVDYFGMSQCGGTVRPADVRVVVSGPDGPIDETGCAPNEPLFFACGTKIASGTYRCPPSGCGPVSLDITHEMTLGDTDAPELGGTPDGCSVDGVRLSCRYRLTPSTRTIESAWRSAGTYLVCVTEPTGARSVAVEDLALGPGTERVIVSTRSGVVAVADPTAGRVLEVVREHAEELEPDDEPPC